MAWDAHSFEAWSRVGRPAKDGHLHASRPRAAGRSVKRALDLLLAIAALILLSPLLLLVAMIVKFSDRGPVFYSHTRVGFGGAPFGCLKFRTMKTDASAQLAELLQNSAAARSEWEATRKLKDDPRITAVGDILRRSSLDELPQLFNVLRGEMSLVGPRPITAEELPRYGEHIWAYMAVRPGLTGHWQTSGRNDVSYEHRVSLDVHYLNNWSLGRDLIIIAKTIPALFSQRGSY
ncbi:exopolysaccharide production protein ExoY [Rhizobium leguminosarum]|uniref:sugar transferase n=1 Tax=Rhizobium leguminosarum TaxID=384 RepID=UPI001616183C|nr:sugar transferase [Rhizobium leguminosarum]MBB5666850.1 exopolysaccharide production protein ExoY [Rhizobium leguminosarum]